MQPIIIGVVLALAVGSSAPWWWSEFFPPESPSQQGTIDDKDSNDNATASSDDTPTQSDTASGGGEDDASEDDAASSSSTAACTIAIENPLVTLYEDTDTFGLEAGRAPPGSYAVNEIRTVDFAGKPQRWFNITAAGDTGWVQDNSILIASKSGDCQ